MKVSVLTENYPGSHLPSEHGLSYFIEYDGKRLLFDTGQSDMFLRNASAMNINMSDIDMIILSHGHFDHGGGLFNLSGGSVICHPGCFVKRYRKSDNSYIGLKKSKDEIESRFQLLTSALPYRISEKIVFLGEIPRLSEFESRTTSFVYEDGTPDYVIDDSAVAFIFPKGLFVITGCGHSGIVNTLEYSKKVTGINKLYGVMGGFHLQELGLQTKETISYLKKSDIRYVLPSHCTGLPSLTAFYENFGIRQVKTGDVLEFI